MKPSLRLFWFIICLTATCTFSAHAGLVDTISVYSPSMKKEIKSVIIRPDNYNSSKPIPVVYMLTGYSGNHASWVKTYKNFHRYADTYNVLIVCVDPDYSSWYWDSPIDPNYQYETYITKELLPYIDQHYATIKDRSARALTGLSMGGHGALYLSIRHQDLFSVAGSMSGGVDIRPFPNNWHMAKRLGPYHENKDVWEKHTVINLLHLIKPKSLQLIIDCGTEDFFYQVNENLHKELLYRNIQHDYIVRPGGHNAPYWENALKYQFLFISEAFQSAMKGGEDVKK